MSRKLTGHPFRIEVNSICCDRTYDPFCDHANYFSLSRPSRSSSFWNTINSMDINVQTKTSLGFGASGQVFPACYKKQDVAVKKLWVDDDSHRSRSESYYSSSTQSSRRSEASKAFLKEVSTLSNVSHENIIKFIGASTLEDVEDDENQTQDKDIDLFIVSELCTGGDLLQFILDHPQPNITQSLSIALGVAQGMQHLHSKDIFHRDLKLKNILLRNKESLTPVIADFGSALVNIPSHDSKLLASMHSDADNENSHDAEDAYENDNSLRGTITYMSPEILDGKEFTAKCDVYSFGIVLWELLTRTIAYQGMRGPNIMYQIIMGKRPYDLDPGSAIHLPPHLQDLIERCLAEDPDQRPTFMCIIDELEDLELHYGLMDAST